MKRFLLIIFVLVLLLGGAIATLPFILSADIIREQAIAAVKSQTGRNLVIEGDASLSVIPNIALKLGKASLSDTPEMGGGVFAQMDGLRVGLELMPLLSGKMQVSGLSLTNPVLVLKRTKSGAVNWAMSNGKKPAGEDQSFSLPVEDLSLGEISVNGGTVSFSDEQAGTETKVEKINLTMSLPNLESMLKTDVSLAWNGSLVTGKFTLNSPKSFLAGESSQVSVDIKSDYLVAKFVGQMATAKTGVSAEGDLNVNTPSLRNLATWSGSPIQKGPGLKDFSVTGRLQATPSRVTLNEATISLDGMKSEGNLVVNLTGKRLGLQATLAVNSINLDTYNGGGNGKSSKKSSRSDRWDTASIDFSPLGAVDADLRLSTGSITYQKIKIGKSALTLSVKDKVLMANLTELQLYKGTAKGQVIVNASGKVPVLSAKTKVSNIQALPFLRDVSGFDWIEGLNTIDLDVSSAGMSQQQLVQSMRGKAAFTFANGAVRGINIAQMVRSLKNLKLSGWSRSDTAKTDFSKLGATFTINKGQATTKDLAMIGPFVRLSGQGTVNLPAKALDFRLNPKLVGSIEGQGGATDLAGLDVPVVVKGPWSKPSIYPDLKGLLKNPENAVKSIESIGKSLKNTKPKDVLKNLLGGNQEQPAGAGTTNNGDQPLNPGSLLQNLLKKN